MYAVKEEKPMLIGSGLSAPEQTAFDVLLKFFDGERDAERKALSLCSPFAALAARRVGLLSDDAIAELVMEVLLACVDSDAEVQYLWGERRDNRRERTQ